YGLPGVGKTLSSRYFANWDAIAKEIDYTNIKELQSENLDDSILESRTIFYTAPPISATKQTKDNHAIGVIINKGKNIYRAKNTEEQKYTTDSVDDIDAVIGREIGRRKIRTFGQLKSIYDRNEIATVLSVVPGHGNRR